MICPKCPGKLRKIAFQNIELDSCYLCEGLWFDTKELDEVLSKDAKNYDFIGLDDKKFDGDKMAGYNHQLDEKEAKCPLCNNEVLMVKEIYEGKIKVDVCPEGHGVWLDGGEILKIRKRFLVNLNDRLKFCQSLIRDIICLEPLKFYARMKYMKQSQYKEFIRRRTE